MKEKALGKQLGLFDLENRADGKMAAGCGYQNASMRIFYIVIRGKSYFAARKIQGNYSGKTLLSLL